jgi:hypothetical protein
MPALAIYKSMVYRVSWMGKPVHGPHAGTKRAKLIPLKGGSGPVWVNGSDIEMIDNKPRGGK